MEAGAIVALMQALPSAITVLKSGKELIEHAKGHLERKSQYKDWCLYVNPLHNFKLSWPTQRWSMQEGFNLGGYIYFPTRLLFRMTSAEQLPSVIEPGGNQQMVPFIGVGIDLNGSISMEKYVMANLDRYGEIYSRIGAKITEEKMSRRVDQDAASFVHRIEFPNVTLLELHKITRFKDKMYSLNIDLFENKPYADVALEDTRHIIDSFALIAE
jgi:hypothetical protein